MEVKDFTASLKEWFFDLAGLFLPGASLLFLLNLIYKNQVHISDISHYYSQDIKINFTYIVTAYITGYVIYGLSLLTDWSTDLCNKLVWNRIPSKSRKRSEIINSSNEYSLFKKLILQKASSETKSDLEHFLIKDNFDEIRNLAMSYSPEADSKIYNFSFRAEICNHFGTVFIILSIACLTSSIFTNYRMIATSFVSIIIAFIFKVVRIKYLDFAYKVPFSIAIVKLVANKQ